MLQRLIQSRHDRAFGARPSAPAGEPPVRQAPILQAPILQAGVIPYRRDPDGVRFLLITSNSGRWIFPKGHCDAGEAGPACAAREAFEEAGLEGEITGAAIGAYHAIKTARRKPVQGKSSQGKSAQGKAAKGKPAKTPGRRVEVLMYPLAVSREHESWPEHKSRQRRWATLDEARDLITTPGLLTLAERAHARITEHTPYAPHARLLRAFRKAPLQ